MIVVGDVGPDTLTPQMQQFLAAAVRDKGATLITIAGQRSMPEKYTGSCAWRNCSPSRCARSMTRPRSTGTPRRASCPKVPPPPACLCWCSSAPTPPATAWPGKKCPCGTGTARYTEANPPPPSPGPWAIRQPPGRTGFRLATGASSPTPSAPLPRPTATPFCPRCRWVWAIRFTCRPIKPGAPPGGETEPPRPLLGAGAQLGRWLGLPAGGKYVRFVAPITDL